VIFVDELQLLPRYCELEQRIDGDVAPVPGRACAREGQGLLLSACGAPSTS